jgi:hypothetical protein
MRFFGARVAGTLFERFTIVADKCVYIVNKRRKTKKYFSLHAYLDFKPHFMPLGTTKTDFLKWYFPLKEAVSNF